MHLKDQPNHSNLSYQHRPKEKTSIVCTICNAVSINKSLTSWKGSLSLNNTSHLNDHGFEEKHSNSASEIHLPLVLHCVYWKGYGFGNFPIFK
jgi:hypothetical protein